MGATGGHGPPGLGSHGSGPGLATGNQYLDNYVHQIGQGVLSGKYSVPVNVFPNA